VDRPSWAPTDIDMSVPSVARVYDYYLGGSHNFESDRAFGDQAMALMPMLREGVRDNRDLLRRVVRHLAEEGVEQFLDLGSGIPTVGNVHEVAQAVRPDARVVYVDHDPVAVAHGRVLLAGNERAAAVLGDVRDHVAVLRAVAETGLIDPSRPVAVLMFALLHFVFDDDRPTEIIAGYLDAFAPGSYLAISHGRADGDQDLRDAARVYDRSRSPIRLRTLAEVRALFDGLTMVEPGVVLSPRWRPNPVDDRCGGQEVDDDYPGIAGVGRRD
jgi:SAM-dependent methyltransferase